jgi:hypothetical protein
VRPVLFLDYDGVLHRGDTYATSNGVVTSSPGSIELFEYASVLDDLLRPYPTVEILVSSDWCLRFGFERAREAIPLESLRARVKGATFDATFENPATWATLERGAQILRYVRRHGVLSPLAVDDRKDGFLNYRDRLVHCQTESGLGDPTVVEVFRIRLREHLLRNCSG